jgi:two-component system invasion response regulator UvrY
LIKVLIVDDHELIREGIKKLLSEVADIKVVGEADNGENAIRVMREMDPDIVLMDVKMPGIGGLETTKRLLRSNPQTHIIALTSCNEEPFPTRILQAGAQGYLTKGCGVEEMVQAIRKVYGGQKYISPEIAQQIALKSLSDHEETPFDLLSERELQVMLMITSGEKVQDISDKLCLSPKTVNSYRYRLFEKLKVNNDVELTHLAYRHGILNREVMSESQFEPEDKS